MNALLAVNAHIVNAILIENENILRRRDLEVKRIRLRDENRLLNLPDLEFRANFRVSKIIFNNLYGRLHPYNKIKHLINSN